MVGYGLKIEIRPRLQQKLALRLTPPLAMSDDDFISCPSPLNSRQELSDKVLKCVEIYISNENLSQPFSDNQVAGYLAGIGYDLTHKDVAYARSLLNIKPASDRKTT